MFIGNILFFLMMLTPRTWQLIKSPLVVVLVLLLFVYYVKCLHKSLNYQILLWFAMLLAYGILWSFIGAIRGNDGVADLFRINVIWVALYGWFVLYFDSMRKFESLVLTTVIATISISLYNLSIVLHALGAIPDFYSFLAIDTFDNLIGIHDGYIHLMPYNIGTLTYLAPFMICIYIIKPKFANKVPTFLIPIATILSVLIVILSGRRALWLEILTTPALIVIFNFVKIDRDIFTVTVRVAKIYSVLLILFIVLGSIVTFYSNWQFIDLYDRFKDAFVAEKVRQEQAVALWNGFTTSPILGSGFGVGVPDVVRDDMHPWYYELSYMLILYNTGILGSFIYLMCILFIYFYGYRHIKNNICDRPSMVSLLVAFTCFIIANATNPYFASYDYMWALFLPIAYININFYRAQKIEKTHQ